MGPSPSDRVSAGEIEDFAKKAISVVELSGCVRLPELTRLQYTDG